MKNRALVRNMCCTFRRSCRKCSTSTSCLRYVTGTNSLKVSGFASRGLSLPGLHQNPNPRPSDRVIIQGISQKAGEQIQAKKAENSRAPNAQAIKEQLDRILASRFFVRSDRLSSFLSFVVEESIRGAGDSLKESVVARRGLQQRPRLRHHRRPHRPHRRPAPPRQTA